MRTSTAKTARAARPGERLPVVTFLLLLAIAALWLRSYERADLLAFFTQGGKLQGVASHDGRVMLLFSNLPFRPDRGLTFDYDSTHASVFTDVRRLLAEQTPKVHGGLGFTFARSIPAAFGMSGKSFTFVTFPHWVLLLLVLAPSTRRLCRLRRADRRERRGQCRACGYDLRESPGRCPECGEEAASAVGAAA